MGVYTKLNFDQVKEILSLYNLPSPVDIIAQSTGISNSNYQVTFANRESVLLKVSNDKDIEQLSQELEILNYLYSQEFKLSLRPHETNTGSLVYSFKEFHGVIFPYVDAKPPEISRASIKALAESLAKLHSIHPSHAIREHTKVGFDSHSIFSFIKTDSCPLDFKETVLRVFSSKKQTFILEKNLEKALIHGDLYYDNSLFSQSKLLKIIDFEQAGVGNILLDLGISISGSCLERVSGDYQISKSLISTYLEAYQSIKAIKNIELINDFIHLGLFSISLWRIKRFLTGNLDSSKKNSYKELLTISRKF